MKGYWIECPSDDDEEEEEELDEEEEFENGKEEVAGETEKQEL
jgi:hypothetical protein